MMSKEEKEFTELMNVLRQEYGLPPLGEEDKTADEDEFGEEVIEEGDEFPGLIDTTEAD